MALMMVLMLKRVEKRPGETPIVFPHPISAGAAFVTVFHVSPPPPITIVQGGIYVREFLI
jgi:hypothetical protein